jgi:D-glycero-alpha-D-manno-heptose-7-phosphate kinase
MIVTRTPLRIPFFSGGSDMPAFYTKERGAAFSATINKFIYVVLHRTPHLGIRTMYDTVEEVTDIDDMQHAIAREVLRYFDVTSDVTVASVSDVLSKGSGLGSSSAFTVGMLRAIMDMRFSKLAIRSQLAEVACTIEMEKCGFPVGKQDQYAAAYGGFNLFEFDTDGRVYRQGHLPYHDVQEELERNLLLVYSGVGRDANNILQKQQRAMSNRKKFDLVRANKDLAYTAFGYLRNGHVDGIGDLLKESWALKKSVVEEISSSYFDTLYDRAISAGATAGKILGAGGGGFLLFYVKPDRRQEVITALTSSVSAYDPFQSSCVVHDFKFCNVGSTVVCHDYEY